VNTLARTSFGVLRADSGGDVLVFRGVPYAAAPTGDLRWSPPQPTPAWTDIRDATAFGPIAPQDIAPERLAKRGLTMDEDCLTLNVWTPAADSAGRPVLVFLHGGGQAQGHGSAPLFDGSRLARRGDLVVVTVNFRLGALGALYAPERLGPGSTNIAMRDQIQALRWVREEIGGFGGDPATVTIMGQSSGAVAIAAMLATWCDLFDRAILQSGGLERVRSTEAAAAVAKRFFAELGEVADPAVEQILAAQRRVPTGFVPPEGPFHPCVDGDVLPEHPLVSALRAPMPPIPILAGTTRDEWRIFDAALPDAEFSETHVRARAVALLGEGRDVDAALDAYRADHDQLRDLASALVTDYHFTAPTEQFVGAHASRGNPVFRYELQWPSPRENLGAHHDTCLPLVFGTTSVAPALVGDGSAAQRMSQIVQDAWITFIRGGDPWQRYRGRSGATMVLGPDCGIAQNHRGRQLSWWEDRYPAYG
jgi:para-nitrobenzyl esterase